MTQLLNAEYEDEHGEKRSLTRQEVRGWEHLPVVLP